MIQVQRLEVMSAQFVSLLTPTKEISSNTLKSILKMGNSNQADLR